ncbi:MAG: GMP synthase [Bacteroidetes bacterium]|nr:GMP synthase [Bacteroidota bacterium]
MNFSTNQIRIAILDLYQGVENQGMRCIRDIIKKWSAVNEITVETVEFNVRQRFEIPDLSFDLYISSGGPGSPMPVEENAVWEKHYFNWLENIESYNNNILHQNKKKVFFICHSFQLACRYYKVANVCKRKSTSFGVFPIHFVGNAHSEQVFEGLNNPFYVVDSRDYQVIEPNFSLIAAMGGSILAIEKDRPHIPLERAVMAVRFNEHFIGTQFHPEADADGMGMYLQREDKKKTVIENHGEAKWQSMIEQLQDKEKILYTYSHVLPNFLNLAINEMA